MTYISIIWLKSHGLLFNKIHREKFKEKRAHKEINSKKVHRKRWTRKNLGIKLLELDLGLKILLLLQSITHQNKKDFLPSIIINRQEVLEKWSMNKERKYFIRKKLKCWKISKLMRNKRTSIFYYKPHLRLWKIL